MRRAFGRDETGFRPDGGVPGIAGQSAEATDLSMSDKKFDAVVIGSGLGGLTAGALLASAGYSVCLLERNFSLGGAASVYKVGVSAVEASLHQTSDARNPRDVKHRHSEPTRHSGRDRMAARPGRSTRCAADRSADAFELPVGFEAANDALAPRFPDKNAAIKRFLGEVEQIHDALWTMKQAREEGSLAKFTRGLWEVAPAAAGWMNSLDDIFTRDFAGAEGAEMRARRQSCSITATIRAGCGGFFTRWRRAAISPRAAPISKAARDS